MKKNKRKELPNPKKRDIIPPDMEYLYFENAGDFPLETENTEYSPVNAWWFAECAFLAYTHPGFARMAYKLIGFDNFKFFHGIGTECMVVWSSQVVIVAFRGTELKSRSVLHEINTDLNTKPVPFELGGRVHKGFLKGLEEIWGGPAGLQIFLKNLINKSPERPLWITGHSLGGALAALSFARIPEAKGLYLYGTPRVGDKNFLALFEGRSVWRIENARDPVPLVPPDIPRLKFNFGDLGTLKFINREGEVHDRRPIFILEAKTMIDRKIKEVNKSMVPARLKRRNSKKAIERIRKQLEINKKEWKKLFDSFYKDFGLNADDHQPIFYVTKLWNALIGD